MLNKIIVDEVEFTADNMEGIIETLNDKLCLNIVHDNKIILDAKNVESLDIVMNDNSTLDISLINLEKTTKQNINIIQYNNTDIVYKDSFKSYQDSKVYIKNELKGNNNKSEISIRAISFEKKIVIENDAVVNKDTKDNLVIEDIKGINEGGNIVIKPIMQIDTNEVIANHFVTIGNIDKESLMYLNSKGLDTKKSKALLLDGFLKSIMPKEK